MAQKIEVMSMRVARIWPFARAACNQKPSVANKDMVRAKHIGIGRLNLAGYESMRCNVIDARLLPGVIASTFLLIAPVFVTAKEHYLALRSIRH